MVHTNYGDTINNNKNNNYDSLSFIYATTNNSNTIYSPIIPPGGQILHRVARWVWLELMSRHVTGAVNLIKIPSHDP